MKRGIRRRNLIACLAVALVVLAAVTFRVTVVHGDSMLPAYSDGQLLLINRWLAMGGPIRRHEVVVVRRGNETLIKRVAHLPGELLSAADSLRFMRAREFFDRDASTPGKDAARLRVPQGRIVILGDNASASDDSRHFGPVRIEDVIGRILIPAPGS